MRRSTFQLSVAELTAWERRTVWVTVIEQSRGEVDAGPVTRRPVRLANVVHRGAFSTSCPRSLSQDASYPSWAAYIDLDRDGSCSEGDVGVVRPEFAWPPGGFSRTFPSWETLEWAPVRALAGRDRIDGSPTSFCAQFFE